MQCHTSVLQCARKFFSLAATILTNRCCRLRHTSNLNLRHSRNGLKKFRKHVDFASNPWHLQAQVFKTSSSVLTTPHCSTLTYTHTHTHAHPHTQQPSHQHPLPHICHCVLLLILCFQDQLFVSLNTMQTQLVLVVLLATYAMADTSCQCAAAQDGWSINCSNTTALDLAYQTTQINSCASACSSSTCRINYQIIQAHHDYCPEGSVCC
jgi:hypothetical protein